MEVLVAQRLSLHEVNSTIRFQILNEALFISHGDNAHRKDLNPTILPPAMGK